MTKVKICGITNLEDALLSVKFGADMLGFNFYEKSVRYITPQKASSIIKQLPSDVIKVGVFVNMEEYRVDEFVELLKLDAVQLHGDEDQQYVDELRRNTRARIIKSFRVSPEFDEEQVVNFDLDGVLLDAYSSELYGGTGERFDWAKAKAVKPLVSDLYLAGGLTPENVSVAVRTVRPYAVDVASGVESAKGKKDSKKVEEFIENAKSA